MQKRITMKNGLIKSVHLAEGITHLEDLSVDKFIHAVENLASFIATEKLDGANLQFGLDENGNFFTTRAAKGQADLIYKAVEYQDTPAGMMFRAAHLGLEKQLKVIKSILDNGEAIEIEVVFGRQPNAITYGADDKSYIAFLRAVEGTGEQPPNQDKVKQLTKALHDKESTIKTTVFDSSDGLKLTKTTAQVIWRFVKSQEIDTEALKNTDVTKEINALKKFLKAENKRAKEIGYPMSNEEVINTNLTKVGKDYRPEFKDEKDRVNAYIFSEFKLPIKEKMLSNFVRKVKPKLQHSKVTDSEDVGIEGVVLLDPDSNDQIKIVDKDVFTTINNFNYSVRRNLNGVVKSTDPLADQETKGGLFGEAKIRIAGIFGLPNLARGGEAKKIFNKFKGSNPSETIVNFAKNLGDMDFEGVKIKILAILKSTLKDVDEKLEAFKKDHSKYKLELKTGKTIGYSAEIVKRTLVSFAELRSNITDTMNKVKQTESLAQLVAILYGKQVEALHDKGKIEESLIALSEAKLTNLSSAKHPLSKLSTMKASQICEAFTATLFASLLLLRNKDKKAAQLLRDPNHASLKGYSDQMSPLNFWGLVLFYPENKDIKPYLSPETYKELRKIGGRFIKTRIDSIQKTVSASNNLNLSWEIQYQNMRVVTLRLENRSQAINTIRNGIVVWDTLELADKNDVIQKTFDMMSRAIMDSPLTTLVRNLSTRTLMHASDKDQTKTSLLKSVFSIAEETVKEDDGGMAATGGPAASAPASDGPSAEVNQTSTSGSLPTTATRAGNIASYPFRLFKGKIIKRMKRDFKKKKKFAKPTEEKDPT